MHPANVRRVVTMLGATLPLVLYSWASPAVQADGIPATPIPGTAAAIEWDLPGQVDTLPGAILVDLVGDFNRIWFVTRVATPSVYRVDLKSGKKVSDAQWLSWQLDATQGNSSGLRRIKASKDRRFVFVRTTVSLQRIDTGMCKTSGIPAVTTCTRTVWNNELNTPADSIADNQSPFAGSDIAIDDYNNVYAAVSAVDTPGDVLPNPQKSFIERVNPNSASSNVTRWYVGGGAGFCASAGLSAPCLSGVAITSRAKDLVYYSEPQGGPDGMGALAELDPVRNTVRRWTFANLNRNSTDPASEPRQVQFDSDGVLWAVTGSGHLVSLDPKRNRMSKHGTPGHSPFLTDPFGVAPDNGVIGYTDTNDVQNNVAMLIPARNFVTVYPDAAVPVLRKTFSNQGIPGDALQSSGFAKPTSKKLDTLTTRTAEGTFVEAVTNSGGSDSLNPTGITPDRSASVGTFFYAIGTNSTGIDRFGRIRLPRGKEHARIERDDDDRDDDGKRADVDDDNDDDGIKNAFDTDQDNDGTPDMTDDDDDDDGIEDSFDTPDHKETRQTSDQDVAAGDYALDQFTVNPGTLLAVVSAVSSNVLAPVSVEVLNEAGQVVASSLASPGAAVLTWTPPAAGGVFTLRVKNQGATPGTISTKILSRELWPL